MDQYLDQPAMPAPPGKTSNLINPPNQRGLWIFVTTITLTVCTLMVWIRMYVALAITKRLRWDDVLVVVSWLLYVAFMVIGIYVLKHGALVDLWNVTLRDARVWLRFGYFAQIIYCFDLLGIKVSVLVLYRRLFVPMTKRNRVYWTIMTVLAFNIMFYISCGIAFIFMCTPIKRAWRPDLPGKCVDMPPLVVATAGLNTVSDFLVLIIPIAVVAKLRLQRKRKAELLALFTASALCLISSIMRVPFSVFNTMSSNQTMTLMRVAMWSFGEITCFFLASCIPMVPRLVQHIKSVLNPRASQPTNIEARNQPPETSLRKGKPSSIWPVLTSLLDTREEEEDPYFLQEVERPSSATKDDDSGASVDELNIAVSKSWEVRYESQPSSEH